MAKGQSGRIVIEVDPVLKRALYGALAVEDSTLKEWFIAKAEEYVSNTHTRDGGKDIKQ
jgi:hypothetical protein